MSTGAESRGFDLFSTKEELKAMKEHYDQQLRAIQITIKDLLDRDNRETKNEEGKGSVSSIQPQKSELRNFNPDFSSNIRYDRNIDRIITNDKDSHVVDISLGNMFN